MTIENQLKESYTDRIDRELTKTDCCTEEEFSVLWKKILECGYENLLKEEFSERERQILKTKKRKVWDLIYEIAKEKDAFTPEELYMLMITPVTFDLALKNVKTSKEAYVRCLRCFFAYHASLKGFSD